MTKTWPIGSVVVRDLAISFSRWGQTVIAIDQVSFEVKPGEWVLLVGPNGAGKSTVLKTICGQLNSFLGAVEVSGRNIASLNPKDLAATVFTVNQDPLLGSAPLLTVFENMYVADPYASKFRKPRTELTERYKHLLEPVGLDSRLKQAVKLLSGGERQLLAMVIASLREAPIVLLDEPLAALDPQKLELCIKQISNMHEKGKTILQVTHDLDALRNVADRIITLKNGKMIKDETTRVLGRVAAQ